MAFFVGEGSSQLTADALFGGPVVAHAQPLGARGEATSALDGCAFLESHPFLDSAIELDCEGVGEPAPPPPAVPTGDTPACEPAVRLVGSYVRRGREDQSFAAITSPSGASVLYREGARVEERSVVAIRESSVLLARDDGAQCVIAMFEPAVAPATLASSRSGVVVTPVLDTRGEASSELGSHVTRISDTRFAIDRSFVDELLRTRALPAARVVPEEVDGRTVGMRIFGVRRDALLGQLGIENGDSLRTINGYDLTDPVSALDAYAQLRGADHLTLTLTRRGQPMTIDYAIR